VKHKVTVNIDQETFERSKQLGVNVSQACTNYLKQLNTTIEGLNGKTECFLDRTSFTKEGLVRSPGFEPGSSTWQGLIDWAKFRLFCEQSSGDSHSRQLVSYAQRYCTALLTKDMTVIRGLSDTMRPNAMKGLSALAKFLGCYDDFKKLVSDSGLKWSGKSADDIFIDRLTSVKDPEEIWTWIRTVKKERPELTGFLDLMVTSGLRLIEAFNSFNLIGALARSEGLALVLSNNGKTRVSGYFNVEKLTLEHFWFRDMFIRRSKKAFISFVPEQLVREISKLEPWVSTDAVQKMVQKRGLQLRFADIREAHATFMNKYLKKEEIDFLHGRVTSGVFMQHYFNPSLISDLKTRVFQGVAEIQEKVKV